MAVVHHSELIYHDQLPSTSSEPILALMRQQCHATSAYRMSLHLIVVPTPHTLCYPQPTLALIAVFANVHSPASTRPFDYHAWFGWRTSLVATVQTLCVAVQLQPRAWHFPAANHLIVATGLPAAASCAANPWPTIAYLTVLVNHFARQAERERRQTVSNHRRNLSFETTLPAYASDCAHCPILPNPTAGATAELVRYIVGAAIP